MAPERGNEPLRGLGRIHHGFQEDIAIRADEHHTLMLVENTAGSRIGEIASRQSRNRHRALNDELGRWGDTQLDALLFELTVGGLFTVR